jgi:peptidase E
MPKLAGAATRTIVAMGGGGFSMEPDNPLLDDHVLALARKRRGHERPSVCFLPTASGNTDSDVAQFYAAFARRCEATHLDLFARRVADLESFLLDQDAVYVGGGNTANMLAIWRVHGLDRALKRAWEAGVVLAGLSAGSNCWFEGSTTDSFGTLAALKDGLGLVPAAIRPTTIANRGDDPPSSTSSRRASSRTAWPPTMAPRSSSLAPSWRRLSPRARWLAPIGWSAGRLAARSKRTCRPVTWAESAASSPRSGPSFPAGGRHRVPRSPPGVAAPFRPMLPSRVAPAAVRGRPAA